MTKYTVLMTRRAFQKEEATFEVEADNRDDARRKAVSLSMQGEGDWDTSGGTDFGWDMLRAESIKQVKDSV